MSRTFCPTGIVILILTLFMGVCSCRTEESTKQDKSQLPSESRDPSQKINRIICAAPSVTEFVYALGLGYKVIGVSDFSTYPPQALEKSKIGGLINPNREKIIALQPDMIIMQGQNDSITRLCQEHKIRFLTIEINSVEDIWKAILRIGRELNVDEEAGRLVKRVQSELHSVRELTRHRPQRRVFLTLGHTPGDLTGLMTAGPKTFIHTLISMAGGENVFHDATGMYPQISKESLIKRQPEVIIEAIPGGIAEERLQLLKKDWSQLPMLPAVQADRIHFLTEDFLLIPGPRIAQTVQRFAQIIHPEAFGAEDDA
jgi:iron complex transport system substrate-binding protein